MTSKRPEYQQLWARLRAKYTYGAQPIIYIINGTFPPSYESDYTWIVGYAESSQEAERTCEQLRAELKKARTELSPYYLKEKLALKAYEKLQDVSKEPKYFKAWSVANETFKRQMNRVLGKMKDQGIPYPLTSIMQDRKFGIIRYSVMEVHKIKYQEDAAVVKPRRIVKLPRSATPTFERLGLELLQLSE